MPPTMPRRLSRLIIRKLARRSSKTMDRIPDTQQCEGTWRVWDPLVRLFHWALAAGFTAAWFTSGIRSETHQWIGLGAAGLIGIRIVWGLAGSYYARFA